jgi:hypothetical protein
VVADLGDGPATISRSISSKAEKHFAIFSSFLQSQAAYIARLIHCHKVFFAGYRSCAAQRLRRRMTSGCQLRVNCGCRVQSQVSDSHRVVTGAVTAEMAGQDCCNTDGHALPWDEGSWGPPTPGSAGPDSDQSPAEPHLLDKAGHWPFPRGCLDSHNTSLGNYFIRGIDLQISIFFSQPARH